MTKMRVCTRALPESLSRGIHRVAAALERYAPDWVEIVHDPDQADLRIGHCIGIAGMEEWCAKGPYALVQYCLRTGGGSAVEWSKIWRNAKAVWSYYDLEDFLNESICTPDAFGRRGFYHAPLGVDGEIFTPSMPLRKNFLIGTSGYIAETEGVLECYRASQALGRMHFHLGPKELGLGPGVTYMLNIPDEIVADAWSQCSFVAGMRRIEGFELPAIEGLMCGARPIMFDAPHYTQWFGEHAEYVPEGPADEVYEAVLKIVSRPVRPVTPAERTLCAQKFDWKKLVTGFWEAMR